MFLSPLSVLHQYNGLHDRTQSNGTVMRQLGDAIKVSDPRARTIASMGK
ncbi:MAG: hypothetical protein AB4352_17850 [Hormoscilla sp.]